MNRSYKSNKREKPVSPLMVYWRRLDKPLILAALLCSVLSIILLYSIWQNHIISSVGSSYYRTQLLSCGLGLACLLVLSAIDYHKLVRLWFLYAPVALVAAWNFILGDTHKKRILVLLHPGTDPENIEYQQDRGLEALSNGKIFGVGLHAGKENYVSVPEIHNDFMFAQVGQALGFVGAVAVVLVLIFLCLKVLYDGFNTKDKMDNR